MCVVPYAYADRNVSGHDSLGLSAPGPAWVWCRPLGAQGAVLVGLTAGVPQLKTEDTTSINVSAMIKVLSVSEHRNLVVQIIP